MTNAKTPSETPEMAESAGVGTLTRLRAQLVAPHGTKRIEALMEADDPAAAVVALPDVEVYSLIHEVGFDESLDLIRLATPNQLRGCIDLDAWDKDRMQLDTIKPWLTAIINTGYERVGEIWGGLDAEFRALFFQRQTIIYDLVLGEEPDDTDERPLYLTSDSFFGVRLIGDDDTVDLLRRMIDDLYRSDPDLARHTLMAARSEPSAELEETSYRWRSGRMADLGYVDFHEALEIFRPLEVSKVVIGEGTEDRILSMDDDTRSDRLLPSAIAEQVLGRSFLARALDELNGEDAARVEQGILVLVNHVLAAGRVRPGEMDVMSRGAHYATATLALGLEAVSRGDIARAATALSTVAIVRLFRAGYTLTLQLARLATALAPRSVTAESKTTSLIAGLCSPRPLLTREIEDPPQSGMRPFESMADIRDVSGRLGELTLMVAVVESLGVNLIAMGQRPEPRPSLDSHLRTALARAAIGGVFSTQALSQTEVSELLQAAFAGGHLTSEARGLATAHALAYISPMHLADSPADRARAEAVIKRLLADLEDTLGELRDGDVDARFVDGILLDVGRS